jgi:hypothetical protein
MSKAKSWLLIVWIGLTTPLYSLGPVLVIVKGSLKYFRNSDTPGKASSPLYTFFLYAAIILAVVLCCGIYQKRIWAFRLAKILTVWGCLYAFVLMLFYVEFIYSKPTAFRILDFLKILLFLGANYLCFTQLPWIDKRPNSEVNTEEVLK